MFTRLFVRMCRGFVYESTVVLDILVCTWALTYDKSVIFMI